MIPSVKKNRINITKTQEYDKVDLLKNNISIIVVYSLFLSIAFAMNGFMSSIFIKITGDKPGITYNFIYLVFLLSLILAVCYFMDVKIGL
jgi:hypothetical protein